MKVALAILWLFLGASICGALPADAIDPGFVRPGFTTPNVDPDFGKGQSHPNVDPGFAWVMAKKPNPHQPAPVAVTPVPAPLPAPQPAPIDAGLNHGNANACWTTGGDGWTVLCPTTTTAGTCNNSGDGTSNGTCFVAVANAGNDTCSAFTTQAAAQAAPCLTIAHAYTLLRSGSPDWLLLKSGDTFTNDLWSGNGFFGKNGRSATEPMLVSSYATGARPLLKTAPTYAEAVVFNTGGAVSNYTAFIGIEFYAYTRDPNSPDFDAGTVTMEHKGVHFLSPTNWQLIEDCKFSFYQTLTIDEGGGPYQNFSIRRNVVSNNYAIAPAHGEGIFIDNVVNLLIEENLFDHNGWNADIAGAEATVFAHNIYINWKGPNGDPDSVSGPANVLGNIFSNSSATGLQLRPGGAATNNLFVANPIALTLQNTADRNINVQQNVTLDGLDLDYGSRTQGFDWFVGSLTVITNNIIAHQRAAGSTNAFGLILESGTSAARVGPGNIICDWDNPIIDSGTGNDTSGNTLQAANCTSLGPFPTRSVGSYAGTLGLTPTLAGFLAAASNNSKANWNLALMANAVNTYIRAGLGQ